MELFELVHQAAASFAHVALYFENCIEKQDLSLLPAAATTAKAVETNIDEVQTEAAETTRIVWRGPVDIDGKLWPIQDAEFVLAPAGKHRLSPGIRRPPLTIADFNGEIRSALASPTGAEVSYASQSRAIAALGSPVSSIEVDGAPFWKGEKGQQARSILLPAGQHIVSFIR